MRPRIQVSLIPKKLPSTFVVCKRREWCIYLIDQAAWVGVTLMRGLSWRRLSPTSPSIERVLDLLCCFCRCSFPHGMLSTRISLCACVQKRNKKREHKYLRNMTSWRIHKSPPRASLQHLCTHPPQQSSCHSSNWPRRNNIWNFVLLQEERPGICREL